MQTKLVYSTAHLAAIPSISTEMRITDDPTRKTYFVDESMIVGERNVFRVRPVRIS